MAASVEILDLEHARFGVPWPQVSRADRRFSVASRYVEYVSRLAQARHTAMERTHERLALRNRSAKVRGTGREITMMKVVGLYPAFDQGTHEFAESRLIVVDPAQKYRLAQHRNSGIDEPRARCARTRSEFARMVGVQHDVACFAGHLQSCNERGRDAPRVDGGDARVQAHNLDMRDRCECLHDLV